MNAKRMLLLIMVILLAYSWSYAQEKSKTIQEITPVTINLPRPVTGGQEEILSVLTTDKYIFLLTDKKYASSSGVVHLSGLMLYSFKTAQWKYVSLPDSISFEQLLRENSEKDSDMYGNSISASGSYLFIWDFGSPYLPATNEGMILNADTAEWIELPALHAPTPRRSQHIIPVERGFLIYGGFAWADEYKSSNIVNQPAKKSEGVPSGQRTILNDAYLYDVLLKKWIPIQVPKGLDLYRAIQWKDKVVFFMKKKESDIQVFLYSIDARQWTPYAKIPDECRSPMQLTTTEKGIYYFVQFIAKDALKGACYLNFAKDSWEILSVSQSSHIEAPILGSSGKNIIVMEDMPYWSKTAQMQFDLRKFNLDSKAWTSARFPGQFYSYAKPYVTYIENKKAFLLLCSKHDERSSNEEVQGFVWYPFSRNSDPVMLEDYIQHYLWSDGANIHGPERRNNVYWTGKYLVGMKCKGLNGCSGFIYEPDSGTWEKINGPDLAVKTPYPFIIERNNNVLVFDELAGKVFTYNMQSRRWLNTYISMPVNECHNYLHAYATSHTVFMQCKSKIWRLSEDLRQFIPVSVKDGTENELYIFPTDSGFYLIKIPMQSLHKKSSALHYIVERYNISKEQFEFLLEATLQLPETYHLLQVDAGKRMALLKFGSHMQEKGINHPCSYYIYDYYLMDTEKVSVQPLKLYDQYARCPQTANVILWDDGVVELSSGKSGKFVSGSNNVLRNYLFFQKKWTKQWELTRPGYNITGIAIATFGKYLWLSIEDRSLVVHHQKPVSRYVLQINIQTGESRILPWYPDAK